MQVTAAMAGDGTPNIREDILAYDAMRSALEAAHMGEWALIYRRDLIATFEDFDTAAQEAVARFGAGPYLIRQVGSGSVTLPTSVMYGPLHAINLMRI